MARPPVSVTRRGPGIRDLDRKLNDLRRSQVLVGIPASETARQGGELVNNAELMYILTNGSALQGIPATPIIEPAIEKAKVPIAAELGQAAKAVFEQDPVRAELHLNRAGVLGANAAKRFFTDPDNGWPANAPSTIAAKGSDRRNIDTGQLRAAITHVVKKN